MLTKSQLLQAGVLPPQVDDYLSSLNQWMTLCHVNTPQRVAHFLAQVLYESTMLRETEEDLDYSADRLLEIFPRYFTDTEARVYDRQPEEIANRVYANRMGNGDEASGDGWRYRGRGAIMLTGKDNYRAFQRWLAPTELNRPDDVAHQYAIAAAAWYWDSRHLNDYADRDDIRGIIRRINGGYNGFHSRLRLFEKLCVILRISPHAFHPTHRVACDGLHLRRQPTLSEHTIICTLEKGTPVLLMNETSTVPWWKVHAFYNKERLVGYVDSRYLVPTHGR